MNVERTTPMPPAAAPRAAEAAARAQFAPPTRPATEPRALEPLSNAQSATPARPTAEARTLAPANEAVLRDVLSPEERAFFDQIAALGPLTYGRPRGNAPSLAPTGQRLDVRG